MDSMDSKKIVQERVDDWRNKLNALVEFRTPDGQKLFEPLVKKFFSGTKSDILHEANLLFPKSKTWRSAEYMKFTWKNWWKNRKKKLGLLVKD